MCGIAGVFGTGSKSELKAMSDIISHRGPDDSGEVWFEEDNCGLAHRRLSIIDLSVLGHQPMKNKSGNNWITFNGEIYNYLELRLRLISLGHSFTTNSDTEVILAAFDQWGYNCLKSLMECLLLLFIIQFLKNSLLLVINLE